jgi:hypothetical protein
MQTTVNFYPLMTLLYKQEHMGYEAHPIDIVSSMHSYKQNFDQYYIFSPTSRVFN